MSLLRRVWARRWQRPATVALALVLVTALAVYPFVDWWLRASVEVVSEYRFGDFGAYRGAVERWSEGESLYRETDEGGFWGTYLYPPVVVLLFWPFGAIPDFRLAAVAWVLSTAVMLWLGLQALVAALGYEMRWYDRLALGWLLAGFHPVVLTAKLGQTALFMGGLLSFSAAAMVRDRKGSSRRSDDGVDHEESPTFGAWVADSRWAVLSGAATAVVGVVKFAYAPIGAHLLHDRRRMAGALLALPPIVWLSIRFFGIQSHETYLEVLRWGVTQGSGDVRSPTLWLAPYYKPLGWVPAAQAVRVLACLGVAALAVLAPPRARRTVFALGVTAVPLFTPQTYTYYFVALVPAAVVLLSVELDRGGRPALVVLGVLGLHLHAYGLKFIVHTVPDVVPTFETLRPAYLLFQPGLWGNALLFGLAAVRVWQSLDLTVPILADERDALGGTASEGD